MSMPRKAMKEMGFQTCCLLCDAADFAGSVRCKVCISNHAEVRDSLPDIPSTPIEQLAVELMQMLSTPHRWDYDEVHGPTLRHYQALAGDLAEFIPLPNSEEISDIFKRQGEKEQVSIIGDSASRSPWKGTAPSLEEAREINAGIVPLTEDNAGVRTVPSRDIAKVDRSDRRGEDVELTDRVAAAEKAAGAPKAVQKSISDDEVARRKGARDAWKGAIEEVEELLDSSLGDESDSSQNELDV
jgi:hypothetical protein